MFIILTIIISAYLLGSLSGALIISITLGLPDPRTLGSGNPGATNVLRHSGKKAALLTLVVDIFKAIIAISIAKLLSTSPWVLASTTLAVFLGHLYPIFFHFRGGKGVATAFGALITLAWPVGLLALSTWLLMALVFHFSSLAAITAALLTPAYMYWYTNIWQYTLISLILSSLLLWKHRSNIRNLLTGQEDKINQK
jgi:glycerol-3-phosphate acyltransferase PlsY